MSRGRLFRAEVQKVFTAEHVFVCGGPGPRSRLFLLIGGTPALRLFPFPNPTGFLVGFDPPNPTGKRGWILEIGIFSREKST